MDGDIDALITIEVILIEPGLDGEKLHIANVCLALKILNLNEVRSVFFLFVVDSIQQFGYNCKSGNSCGAIRIH